MYIETRLLGLPAAVPLDDSAPNRCSSPRGTVSEILYEWRSFMGKRTGTRGKTQCRHSCRHV